MNTKQRKSERVTFRLSREQLALLQKAAEHVKKDESQYVRDLVLLDIGKFVTGAAA